MGIEHLSASARNVWTLGQARDLAALPLALTTLDAADRAALTGLLETWSKTVPDDAAAQREPSDEPDWSKRPGAPLLCSPWDRSLD